MQKLTWLVAAIAGLSTACGDVKGTPLADAPPLTVDAPPPVDGAPVPDAPPGPVRVTVLTLAGDGAADLTAKVIFQNPDGSLIAEGTVDAMGKAQALMPLGGTVSAIRVGIDNVDQRTAQITSTLGVKPGDEITLGLPPPQTPLAGGAQTTMTANFTPIPEAETVVFSTSCGVPTGSTVDPVKGVATLVFRDSCHGPTFDLLGIASGGRLLAPRFLKLTRITHAGGTSFTIPSEFAATASFAVNLSNIPDVISNLTVSRSSMIEGTPVAPQTSAAVDPPAGALTATVPYPPAFGTRCEVAVSLNRPETRFAQRHEVRTSTLASSIDVDVGSLAVPWLTNVVATTTGMTWAAVDGATPGDGMLTQWSGRWLDGNRTVSVIWRVIQPVTATGMTLPALPVADAAFDPGQQTVAVTPLLSVVLASDYSNVAGYDELRRLPEALLISSMSTLGAFRNEPFQRRTFAALTSQGLVGVRPEDVIAAPRR
ncbi:MAG: hypothetical protein H7138_23620 [Myxococcales bacterium]|nr:hypothetical protein [Myxococcales bacterium]